jgi:histone H3/H4
LQAQQDRLNKNSKKSSKPLPAMDNVWQCAICGVTLGDQLVPLERISEFFEDVVGHRPSEAITLQANITCAESVKPANEAIKEQLINADAVNFDETSLQVENKLCSVVFVGISLQLKSLYTSQHLIVMIKMSELPIAPVTRIIRNAGAERVSDDASQELIRLLEEEAEKIAGTAVNLARHAKRKTVTREDIEEATK